MEKTPVQLTLSDLHNALMHGKVGTENVIVDSNLVDLTLGQYPRSAAVGNYEVRVVPNPILQIDLTRNHHISQMYHDCEKALRENTDFRAVYRQLTFINFKSYLGGDDHECLMMRRLYDLIIFYLSHYDYAVRYYQNHDVMIMH